MMRSLAFPKMFGATNTILYEDHEATASNLRLVILSSINSLFGDPYFGTNTLELMFEQNGTVLKDIVIDNLYTTIRTFMPQLKLSRKDITVTSDKKDIYVNIKAINMLDYTTDMFNIKLTDSEGTTT